ncbi:MAG TPA: metallophosphoesterase [Blastocatellia bacterium]|nr:metallophosphoesterase [Blastocatellia bacterium]
MKEPGAQTSTSVVQGVQISGWVWIRKRRLVFALAVAGAILIFAYAFWIEPYWIEVTHHTVTAPLNLQIKIAHLTDIHTSGLGRRELNMLQIVEAEKPDLIVITGDSINVTSDYPGLRDVLKELHAPLGVWVVRGNHEDWWPVENEQEFYKSAGATLLLNASAEVRDGVWLVGFDDVFGGSPDLEKAFVGVPESAYKIALFHSPVYFEEMAGRSDLVLAGHSHGGQVRLPVVGAVWTPPFVGEYFEGWFERRGTRMYVSRGVGTSIIDVRFWCRPEVAMITLGARDTH